MPRDKLHSVDVPTRDGSSHFERPKEVSDRLAYLKEKLRCSRLFEEAPFGALPQASVR